jgi:hypothetical protein
MICGLTDEAVSAFIGMRGQYDERGGIHVRRADRHDAALRRHKPFAFMQGDRRKRDGISQPCQRMIAEVELQSTFDGHDRTTGAQIVHGHLTGGKT